MLTDRKSVLMRRICVTLVTLWSLSLLVYPVWIGKFYNAWGPDRPNEWFEGGVFGLEDGGMLILDDPWFARAPLWKPPRAHSPDIDAKVRWPWQPVGHTSHIEISLLGTVLLLSLGMLALGPLLLMLYWLNEHRQPDAVVSTTWWGSLALGATMLGLFVVGLLSFGGILEYAGTIIILISVSYLVGAVFGYRKSRKAGPVADVASSIVSPQAPIEAPRSRIEPSLRSGAAVPVAADSPWLRWRRRYLTALTVAAALYSAGVLSMVLATRRARDIRDPYAAMQAQWPGAAFGVLCWAGAFVAACYFLGVVIYVATHLRNWNATNTDRTILKRDLIRMVLVIVLVLSIGGILIDGRILQ